MKSIITTVIATLFISLPVTVFAEGGYRWEKNAEKSAMSHKMSMDSHMGHASSGHGSMMKNSEHGSMMNRVGHGSTMKESSGMGSGHAKSDKNMKQEHEVTNKK